MLQSLRYLRVRDGGLGGCSSRFAPYVRCSWLFGFGRRRAEGAQRAESVARPELEPDVAGQLFLQDLLKPVEVAE